MKTLPLLLTAAGLVAAAGTAQAQPGFAEADRLLCHISEEAGAVTALAGPYRYDPAWDELYRTAATADTLARTLRTAVANRDRHRVEQIARLVCRYTARLDDAGHHIAASRPRTCGATQFDGLILEVERLSHNLGEDGLELKALISTLPYPLPCGCDGPVCNNPAHRHTGYGDRYGFENRYGVGGLLGSGGTFGSGYGSGYGYGYDRHGQTGLTQPPLYGQPGNSSPTWNVPPIRTQPNPRYPSDLEQFPTITPGAFPGGQNQFAPPALPAPVSGRFDGRDRNTADAYSIGGRGWNVRFNLVRGDGRR